MEDGASKIKESGVATLSDALWNEAKRRFAIIAPLAQSQLPVGRTDALAASDALGLTVRHIYTLIHRLRNSDGTVSGIAPKRSCGGKGTRRLSDAVEAIISKAVEARYLSRQRIPVTAVHKGIMRDCREAGVKPPALNTVIARIKALDPHHVMIRRKGRDSARSLESAGGMTPIPEVLLGRVEIDHTPVDVIIVDEKTRQPIGRPYLTLAIDTTSRCILGFVVTLDEPSATSVCLCLTHAATNKQPWLEARGIDAKWPMCGKPSLIYVDNGAEFHSEALRRGCEQHGIELKHRPPGKPNFGGIIERVIGTFMQKCHELPGTTFSNVAQRKDYEAEKLACLTLAELERWMALAILGYHGTSHRALGRPPEAVWSEYVGQQGEPVRPSDLRAFTVDFLPILWRRLGRAGFQIDHIGYYSDALRAWISRRGEQPKFLIRRDPRDLSRIWALSPDKTFYIEVPYRFQSRPAVSLWEHREAVRKLKEQSRSEIDETSLFRTIDQMRAITTEAVTAKRKALRNQERRRSLPKIQTSTLIQGAPQGSVTEDQAEPYRDIEQW